MLSGSGDDEGWRHTLIWIARSVDEYGERPAIIDRGEALSYVELWRWADAISTWLRAQEVGQGHFVGLRLDASAAYVAALLGTWIARAAFVPLPSDLPELRRGRILAEIGPRAILTREQVLRLRPPQGPAKIEHESRAEAALGEREDAEELAYVLYTSGSSGEPKGVMITHRGIPGLLRAQVRAFDLGPHSRSLFMLSPAFDASISDIGTALFAGAALVIVDREQLRSPSALLRVLERESITYVDMPPALLRYLDPSAMPASLETIVIGGEVCPSEQVRRFSEVVRLVSVYGPTEATVCASLLRCGPSWSRPLLGQPLPGVVFRVLNDIGDEVGPTGEGELYIGGQGLARGYLARPQQSAERFIERKGERLYRSGDRVRIDAEGQIEFRGRIDRQRKIGGVRIELDEIEAELVRHPDVLEAAVFDGRGGSLIAAVILRSLAETSAEQLSKNSAGSSINGSAAPSSASAAIVRGLREHLARALPRAALPRRMLLRASLPRTPSGKIDRGALEGQSDAEAEFSKVGQRGACGSLDMKTSLGSEASAILLLTLWRRVLALPHVDRDDRFCDLGGDSLSALELVAVAEAYGLSVSAPALLRNPSIAELTKALGHVSGERRTAAELRDEVGRCARSLDDRLAENGSVTDLRFESASRSWSAGNLLESRDRDRDLVLDPDVTLFMTGATGFLGRHLLSLLARRHRGRIIVLVRAKDSAHAQRRLDDALASAASIVDESRLPEPQSACLEVLVGDLSRPHFGLARSVYSRLCREVDTIVHSAAIVNLAAGFDALRAVNLGGTAMVAELAMRGRTKLLHAISTLSVFVAASPLVASPMEDDGLSSTEAVTGGYAQSKWAAEVLLREVGRGRFSLVCHRLGLITGHTRGGVVPDRDQLMLFFRGVAELGAVPEGYEALRIDISPVDAVARALAELIVEGPACAPSVPLTYHIASERGANGASLVAALRRAGVVLEVLPRSQWRGLVRGLGRRSPAAAVAYLALGRCLEGQSSRHLRAYDLFQATGFRFDQRASTAILGPRGLSIPPARPALLDCYVAAALGGRE